MGKTSREVIADGWRMKWDLDCAPPQIDVWNAEGVWQYTESGQGINERKVKKAIEKFKLEHSGQMQLDESSGLPSSTQETI